MADKEIKMGDFIEIDYTGHVFDSKEAFDTTDAAIAKKEGIHSPKTTYESLILPLGEGYTIRGLETRLVGKTIGKYNFHIPDVEAFGKKNASKLQLVPAKFFKTAKIRPFPGLQVNIDDSIGIVRTVSGGRIIVDFNHPLSSRDVEYDVNVKRIINDTKEKVEATLKLLGFPHEGVTIEKDSAVIKTKVALPAQLTGPLCDNIKKITNLKKVEFDGPKPENKTNKEN